MASDDKKVDETGKVPAPQAVKVGRESKPLTQQVGRVAMVVAGGVFAMFAIFNAQFVDFSWVFGSTEVLSSNDGRISGGVPLIVLLVAAFGLGIIVGLGARSRRTKSKSLSTKASTKK